MYNSNTLLTKYLYKYNSKIYNNTIKQAARKSAVGDLRSEAKLPKQ